MDAVAALAPSRGVIAAACAAVGLAPATFHRRRQPLRQQGPAATTKTHRCMDQPAKPETAGPSLISQTGCLIVVDTFRNGTSRTRVAIVAASFSAPCLPATGLRSCEVVRKRIVGKCDDNRYRVSNRFTMNDQTITAPGPRGDLGHIGFTVMVEITTDRGRDTRDGGGNDEASKHD